MMFIFLRLHRSVCKSLVTSRQRSKPYEPPENARRWQISQADCHLQSLRPDAPVNQRHGTLHALFRLVQAEAPDPVQSFLPDGKERP
jgi:hypothetical protein